MAKQLAGFLDDDQVRRSPETLALLERHFAASIVTAEMRYPEGVFHGQVAGKLRALADRLEATAEEFDRLRRLPPDDFGVSSAVEVGGVEEDEDEDLPE